MKKILIIGNGLSRKDVYCQNYIKTWEGEIWACNRAYLEYFDFPRIDVLSGDPEALIPAYDFKIKHNLNFRIIAKNDIDEYTNTGKFEKFDTNIIPKKYIKNTGFTLALYAYYSGYREIKLIGFDLGGKDIYVKGLENKDKSSWIHIWREFFKNEPDAKNCFEFIGNDSWYWVNSYEDTSKHVKRYLQKEERKRTKSVLILGNGITRLAYKNFIDKWGSEIWGCNWFFRDVLGIKSTNNVTRIGTVHSEVAEKAYIFKKENKLYYEIYSLKPLSKKIPHKIFQCKKGYSTGNMFLYQAYFENYARIFLLGFDFGGRDVYQKHNLIGSNFIKQFKEIVGLYGRRKLKFIGKTPDWIRTLPLKGTIK